jgi:hypothetical protein
MSERVISYHVNSMTLGVFKVEFEGRVRADFVADFSPALGLMFG